MTNLSKELCEVCGIELKLPCKRCGASKFALGQCAEVKCKAVYLDFENSNNNFVKLWELPLNHNTDRYNSLGELLFYLNVDFWSRDTFLKSLLYYLTSGHFDSKQVEQVKQAIKQADWEY